MQYRAISCVDKDGTDVWMTVSEEPSWYNFFSEGNYRRFWGSGSLWYEIVKDRFGDDKEERCGPWMSSILHDLWWDRIDKFEAKTCKPRQ